LFMVAVAESSVLAAPATPELSLGVVDPAGAVAGAHGLLADGVVDVAAAHGLDVDVPVVFDVPVAVEPVTAPLAAAALVLAAALAAAALTVAAAPVAVELRAFIAATGSELTLDMVWVSVAGGWICV